MSCHGAGRRAPAADGDAVAVEDQRASGITARQRRDQPLSGCSSAAHRSFPGCDGARQRVTHVAAPFADTFLLGDVPVAYVVSSPVSPAGPHDARLRGGAPHEAEGRHGARDSGAGRVRPPAGRRLCVLRQILNELVAGLEQFLFVDDVVAVEDGAGLVAGQEHGDALGDTGADQVAGGGAAAIVEEAGRHPVSVVFPLVPSGSRPVLVFA